jgi:hypothetical protein
MTMRPCAHALWGRIERGARLHAAGRLSDARAVQLVAGRYWLESVIGKGGFGTVHRALDLSTVAPDGGTTPETLLAAARDKSRSAIECLLAEWSVRRVAGRA